MENRYRIDREFLHMLYDGMDSQNNSIFYRDMVLIENLLFRLDNEFKKYDYGDSSIELLKEDLQILYQYKPLYKHVKDFLKTSNLNDDELDIVYKKCLVSNDDAIEIASSFFREQGSFFSTPLSEFLEDKNDHIEFIEPCENCDGEMVYLGTADEAFIVSADYQDIRKVTILIHELEHVIDSFNNSIFFYNTFVREIATMFMEMIGSTYVSKELNLGSDGDMRKYHQRYCVLTGANFIYEKNQFLSQYKKHINMDNDELHRLINKDGISDRYLEYFISTNICEDYYYQLAHFISVEIYMIYMNDKRKGLEIIKDIIMNGNDYNIFSILDKYSIKLNSSGIEYEKGLYLSLKK